MRTPWRFFADLVSRKPATDKIDDPARAGNDGVRAMADHKDEAPVGEAVETDTNGPVGREAPVDSRKVASSPSAPVANERNVTDDAAAGQIDEVDKARPDTVRRAPAAGRASETGSDVSDDSAAHPTEKSADVPQFDHGDDIGAKSEATGEPHHGKRQARPAISQGTSDPKDVEKPPVINTALEEMAELDVEIATLRLQLSRKLARQNAQLRSLLARFGS